MESYEKLVRDEIPAFLDAKGIPYEERVATDEEFRTELLKKLTEEVGEFLEAGDPSELADVIEVIETLRTLPEFADVERLRLEKLVLRGGFSKKLILKGQK